MIASLTRLSLRAVTDSQIVRLFLAGELDVDSADLLVAEGERLLADNQRNLLIDVAAVTFCDSFGLHALQALSDHVQPSASITIARPSAQLVRILEITGLADQFGVGGEPCNVTLDCTASAG